MLGEGDARLLDELPSFLEPDQVVFVGVREPDESERAYMEENGILNISVSQVEKSTESIMEAVRSRGRQNLYIHIDLDVLDPEEFPYVPVPSLSGISIDLLSKALIHLDNTIKEPLADCSTRGSFIGR